METRKKTLWNSRKSQLSAQQPAVLVTIGSYTYRTTVGVMGGRSLIPVSADHRRQAQCQELKEAP